MTADELYRTAKESLARQRQDLPEKLVQDMKRAAQQGCFHCYYYDHLTQEQLFDLAELRFVVTEVSTLGESGWKVRWDHIEWQ